MAKKPIVESREEAEEICQRYNQTYGRLLGYKEVYLYRDPVTNDTKWLLRHRKRQP